MSLTRETDAQLLENLEKLIISHLPDMEELLVKNGAFHTLTCRVEEFEKIFDSDISYKSETSLGNISLSERDVNLLLNIIKGMTTKNNRLRNYLDTLYDKKIPFLLSPIAVLADIKILPAIQYLIFDAIVSGGVGCGNIITVSELNDASTTFSKSSLTFVKQLTNIFLDANLRWNDFFIKPYSTLNLRKDIYTLVMEKDNPDLLLAMLNKQRFDEELINRPIMWFDKCLPSLSMQAYLKNSSGSSPMIDAAIKKDIAVENQILNWLQERLYFLTKSRNNFQPTFYNNFAVLNENIRSHSPSFNSLLAVLLQEFHTQKHALANPENYVTILNTEPQKNHSLRLIAHILFELYEKYIHLIPEALLLSVSEQEELSRVNFDFIPKDSRYSSPPHIQSKTY